MHEIIQPLIGHSGLLESWNRLRTQALLQISVKLQHFDDTLNSVQKTCSLASWAHISVPYANDITLQGSRQGSFTVPRQTAADLLLRYMGCLT